MTGPPSDCTPTPESLYHRAGGGSELLPGWEWEVQRSQAAKPVPIPRLCPRYLDNIYLHPEEEKYQKIKLQNKVFQVRAASSDF